MTDKESFKEVMEQKKFEIQVRNLTNGFMLEVNQEGYMYYDVISLIEGICIHVGLERFNAMTKKEIKTMIEAIKDGSIAKTLQAEVTELKADISEKKYQIRMMKREIKELKRELNIEE